jgi:putative membrane protein insertion efficiency factor
VSPAAATALALLKAYKILISPLFVGSCRYHPSCSDYMAQAVRRFGAIRGTWLGLSRLVRCLPFGGHGYDPVPPRP